MNAEELSVALVQTLEEARRFGLLGPGAVEQQIAHAKGFARAVQSAADGSAPPRRVLDLGSGGGLPGLVLALEWPTAQFVLLDAGSRRAEFLEGAVARCRIADRVSVVCARAEEAGRDPGLREAFDLVVARSFAPPATTAECAAPFLWQGGLLAVSDRPEDHVGSERWDVEGLAKLGMGEPVRVRQEFGYVLVSQVTPCPPAYPRRVGVAAKRPLF